MDPAKKNQVTVAKKIPQSLQKSFVKLQPIFLTSSIVLLWLGIFLQIKELIVRSRIGIGLTDEAFGILNAVDRGTNGQRSQTPIFADVTSIMLKVADYDVQRYRFFGFIILSIVIIALCVKTKKLYKVIHSRSTMIFFFSIAIFVILLLPSSFRYLLVTPSYQWFVLVGSIALVIVLSTFTQLSDSKRSSNLLILGSLIVFIIELSRLTSGFATWLLVNIFLQSLGKTREILTFNFSLTSMNLLYISLNYESFMLNLSRLSEIRSIDPVGSNIVLEFADIMKTSVILFLLVILSSKITSSLIGSKENALSTGHIFSYGFAIQGLALSALLLMFPYRDFVHFLAFACVVLLGVLIRLNNSQLDYRLLLLSAAPIVSQFGSNTSSSYLIVPLILSPLLYLLLSGSSRPYSDLRNMEAGRLIQTFVFYCLSLSLIFVQVSLSSTSYENGYPVSAPNQDSESGLLYSSEKMASIIQLRSQARLYENFNGQRVLDLSYWHPGVIYYLGGLQFPFSTVDRSFANSLVFQVQSTTKQVLPGKTNLKVPVIIQTSSFVPSLKCENISNQIDDANLTAALELADFDPLMREVAIYQSTRQDITLFPRNISLLLPCTK